MTSTGLLLIPLGFVLILMPWHVSLVALPSFALLHGAAVVNIGSVGLQPGYFFALLVVTRTFVEIALLRQPLNGTVLLHLVSLALFVVISVLVMWTGLTFFAGKVMVIGGTDGLDLTRARPYEFRRENVTQITYLLINSMLVYAVAHQVARMSRERILQVVDKGILIALLFAVVVCAWQLLAHNLGIYFASEVFFSNVGYHRADHQGFFGYLRLNGPFSEPSALAYFFAGFLFYCWKRYRIRPTVLSVSLVLVCVAAVFLAYSTTGYLVLAALVAMAAFDLLVHFVSRRIGPLRVTPRGIAVSGLLLLTIAVATLWASSNWGGLNAILEISLFQKDETLSFEARTGTDLMALQIIAETGGLGIGLGSHKPNSLLLTLLSNVGLAGTTLFGLFVVSLLRPRPFGDAVTARPDRLTATPLRFFIVGLLFVHAISNPNFNVVILWIGFGLMVGYLASLQVRRVPAVTHDEFEEPSRPHRPSSLGLRAGRS